MCSRDIHTLALRPGLTHTHQANHPTHVTSNIIDGAIQWKQWKLKPEMEN